jgi:hypothetical protein
MSRGVKLRPRAAARLKNATTLGFASRKAEPGDWLIYVDNSVEGQPREHFARMIGVIERADRTGGLDDCKGLLCVASLSQNGCFFYERWIHPDSVIECRSMEKVREGMDKFLNMKPAELFAWIRRE